MTRTPATVITLATTLASWNEAMNNSEISKNIHRIVRIFVGLLSDDDLEMSSIVRDRRLKLLYKISFRISGRLMCFTFDRDESVLWESDEILQQHFRTAIHGCKKDAGILEKIGA